MKIVPIQIENLREFQDMSTKIKMRSNINFVSVKCPKCSKEIIKDIFSTDNKVEKDKLQKLQYSFLFNKWIN